MLIVRHERLDEGAICHERFWLGDLNAAGDDVAGSLDVWVDADGARLVPVQLAAGGSPTLERRLVGAALRELVGRGVLRVRTDGPPGDVLVEELRRLGFERGEDSERWEAGGAG